MFQEQEKFIFKCREKYGHTFVDKEFDYYLQSIKPTLNSNIQDIGNNSSGMYFSGYNDIPIYTQQNDYFNFYYPHLYLAPNLVNTMFPLDANLINQYSNTEQNNVILQDLSLVNNKKECDKDSTSTKGDCTTKNTSFYSEKEQTKSPNVNNEVKKDLIEMSPIHQYNSLETITDNYKATDPRLKAKKNDLTKQTN